MEDNFFSISDIADKLQYSKTYIYRLYNKNKNEFKPFIKIVKGVTYLSAEGLNLIVTMLKPKDEPAEDEAQDEDMYDPQQELIDSLKSEIEFLREQLRSQTEIVKREQQLRMTESQNILMLEQHVKEVDQRLISWREETKPERRKGFWERLIQK